MAIRLTEAAKSYLFSGLVEPALVLKLEGYENLIVSELIGKKAFFGDDIYFGDDNLVFGGSYPIGNVKALVSFGGATGAGTSTEVTQQLEPDKGAVSSPSRMNIRLTDYNGEVTRLISPDKILDDILFKYVEVFWGDKRTTFPDDFIPIFFGYVTDIRAGSGYIDLTVTHADEKKRSSIFLKKKASLVSQLRYLSRIVDDVIIEAYPDIATPVQVYVKNGIVVPPNTAAVNVSGYQITIDVNNTTAERFMEAIKAHPEANNIVKVKLKKGGSRSTVMSDTGGFVFLVTDDEIDLDDVTGFLPQVLPIFKTYVRIGDEIIKYTGIDVANNKLTGCSRAALGSFGFTHEAGAEVESFYELGDETIQNSNPIDLSLMVHLSGADEFYFDESPLALVSYGSFSNNKAVIIKTIDPDFDFGITKGDKLTVYDSPVVTNNQSDLAIVDIIKVSSTAWALVTDSIAGFSIEPINSTVKVKIKSRYNLLPDGLGLIPKQVDINRFLELKRRHFSSLPSCRLYLKDTVSGYELVDKELYLPSGFFSIPRRGRASVGYSSPVLVNNMTRFIGLSEVMNPDKIVLNRSIYSNFFNSVIYRYEQDSVTDKFLESDILLAADSVNRIKTKNRPLKIDAGALRRSSFTKRIIRRISRQFIQRYKFGAEWLDIECPIFAAVDIEVGDPVIFGGPETKVSDTKSGTRDFAPRIFEVINTNKNLLTGKTRLRLVDTRYSIDLRTGVVSPSSYVDQVLTGNRLLLTQRVERSIKEQDHWMIHVGFDVELASPDFSERHIVKLVGFDAANDLIAEFDSLPSGVQPGWIVRIQKYESINTPFVQYYKDAYCFICPVSYVVSVTGPKSITVTAADINLFFVGSKVMFSSNDFTFTTGNDELFEVVSIDTANSELTFDKDLVGVTAGNNIHFIGFSVDSGAAYIYT